jgi:hypothetical protein
LLGGFSYVYLVKLIRATTSDLEMGNHGQLMALKKMRLQADDQVAVNSA